MESVFFWVTVPAIAILVFCIIASHDQNKYRKTPTNMCVMAIASLVIGIIAGPEYQMVAYTLMGMGVLLGFMDLIIN